MRFKRLKTTDDLELFRQLTEKQINVLYPLEYFKRSKVFAAYDNSGQIRGGFVIIPDPPFVEIECIPDEHIPTEDYTGKNIAEVTALWLDFRFRRSFSTMLWLKLLLELTLSGKTRFLYAYPIKLTYLQKIYALGNPKVIYRGPTKTLSGVKKMSEESVEVISLWNVLITPIRHPGFMIKRFLKTMVNFYRNQ